LKVALSHPQLYIPGDAYSERRKSPADPTEVKKISADEVVERMHVDSVRWRSSLQLMVAVTSR